MRFGKKIGGGANKNLRGYFEGVIFLGGEILFKQNLIKISVKNINSSQLYYDNGCYLYFGMTHHLVHLYGFLHVSFSMLLQTYSPDYKAEI